MIDFTNKIDLSDYFTCLFQVSLDRAMCGFVFQIHVVKLRPVYWIDLFKGGPTCHDKFVCRIVLMPMRKLHEAT